MKVSLTMTGGTELAQRLALMGSAAKPAMTGILKTAAEPMRARMGILAPRGSQEIQRPERAEGHMADHMVVSATRRAEGEPLSADQAAVAVGPAAAYWWGRFSEYGTMHMPARAFARPAFDTTVNQCLGIMQDEGWKVIRETAETGRVPNTGGGML